jgi:hypothetical protein
MLTVYGPATLELQVRVAVAVGGTVTLPGVMGPQVRFAETVSVNVTVPEKLPTAETVIVELADVPAWTAAGEVAEIVKSLEVKMKEAVVE